MSSLSLVREGMRLLVARAATLLVARAAALLVVGHRVPFHVLVLAPWLLARVCETVKTEDWEFGIRPNGRVGSRCEDCS